jgi:hypothetical protein
MNKLARLGIFERGVPMQTVARKFHNGPRTADYFQYPIAKHITHVLSSFLNAIQNSLAKIHARNCEPVVGDLV